MVRGHYLLNDRLGGVVTATNPDNDRTTVLGFSREYDFEIHKPAANPLFAIQQYKPAAREGSATAVSRLWESVSTLHPLLAAENFSGVKLPEFLSGKVGRIVAVNAFDEDGETHVRVEVECTIAADQKVHSGWAVLNPWHWAILKYEQNYGGWLIGAVRGLPG